MTASNLYGSGLIQKLSSIHTPSDAAHQPDGRASLLQNVEKIKKSRLFDCQLYAGAIGATKLTADELVEHYLLVGEKRGFSGSRIFDVSFYRETNPDVIDANISPLLHYIDYGRWEGRYPNHEMLSFDAVRVKKSGLFEKSSLTIASSHIIGWFRNVFLRHPGSEDGLEAIEQHLACWRFGYRINEFDAEFYWKAYPDVHRCGRPPLIHYIEIGRTQGRFANRIQLKEAIGKVSAKFDENFYRRGAVLTDTNVDAVEHYLTIGQFRGLRPSADFDPDYYHRAYLDIGRAAVDGFSHFVVHGSGEGRVGHPNFASKTIAGAQIFDRSKRTIVIVNHDSSRTGAPLVGLELARHLSRSWNVITYCGRPGTLVDDFVATSVCTVVGPLTALDAEYLLTHLITEFDARAAVLNSVESAPFAEAALYANVPSVALLHEFSEYTFPAGKMPRVVSAVDRVVVPARIIFESVQKAVKREFGEPANNLTIRPQGWISQLPDNRDGEDLTVADILARLNISGGTKPSIVLGAGFVHMRKGVELFVETANAVRRQLGDDIRFVWVGDGYEPKKDVNYSVWISETVERLGLQDIVHFFTPQGSLKAFFDVSDAFFLSSRLDPFPNVVLDALNAGKEVVCFEKATGAADLFANGLAEGAAVEYGNVEAAAAALVKILRADGHGNSEKNRTLIEDRFRFQDYAKDIEREIAAAIDHRTKLELSCNRMKCPGGFDPEFHEGQIVGHLAEVRARRDYAARQSKGLRKFNPRAGFSDGYYRARHGVADGDVALDHALRSMSGGEPVLTTHRCIILQKRMPERRFDGRIALHIHLHYSELAKEFAERLDRLNQEIDLFVTTTSAQKRRECEQHFDRHQNGKVTILEVPNQGRDIGPFLTSIADAVRGGNYDVIGHLHGKRSLGVNEAMGDRWRAYLLDLLLGPQFSQLINIFSDEENVGLIFAEDRHSAGWDANYDVARSLAGKLDPPPKLSSFPAPFPLGTMFWARPAAVEPLWRLGLQIDDFPREPIGYDGTALHAIERMLPAVCEAAGFSWCTVYNRTVSW